MFPFGYRIPPTRVPGATLEQSHRCQDRTDDDTPRAQRLHGVLATGRSESAGRHPCGRHIGAIELDTEDQCPGRGGPQGPPPRPPLGLVHARALPREAGAPASSSPRRVRPDRTCLSSSRESAVAAPGSARSTMSVSEAEPRRDLHRYDEAGVRLDVESPPARQPCSRPVRNADRRHSPRTRCDRVRERERPDPAAPDDASADGVREIRVAPQSIRLR